MTEKIFTDLESFHVKKLLTAWEPETAILQAF